MLCGCVYRLMYKVSTPGDREYIARRLPTIMTQLETRMPLNWNSTVLHLFTFHTISTIEKAGPYIACNILDMERFHTLFKGLTRGTKNVIASIRSHFLLLEVSLAARLDEDMTWTCMPASSTLAVLSARLASQDRADRLYDVSGSGDHSILSASEFQMVQTLWADENPVYKDLHRRFNRFQARQSRQNRM